VSQLSRKLHGDRPLLLLNVFREVCLPCLVEIVDEMQHLSDLLGVRVLTQGLAQVVRVDRVEGYHLVGCARVWYQGHIEHRVGTAAYVVQ